jgi:MFS transporter, FSR family, fosmidomycin resistance protein
LLIQSLTALKASRIILYLSVFGLTHLLVDASCLILILGGIDAGDNLLTYVLLYNILAFGLQMPFGWVIDRIRIPAASAVLGCAVLSLGLMFFIHPLTSVILAGIGNALFHVGGGTVSLNLKPGKASMPGVFVAPGGIGLFAGGLVLKQYGFQPGIPAILLAAAGLIILLLKSPPILYEKRKVASLNYPVLIIVLLLVTICIRSAVGLSTDFHWKSEMPLLLMLTFAIALGKGVGGFLSDWFGWIRITVGGLVVSALLLYFGSQFPFAGITGMVLFNMTMPVTLVAISNLLPGRPGFSFGLTTLALLAGSLPTFFRYKVLISDRPVALTLILLSALILFIGLRLYYRNRSLE